MRGTAMRRIGRRRVIAGFLIAPLVPGLIASSGALFSDGFNAAALYLVIAILFGYPVTLAVGVPLYFLLAERKWTSLSCYALASPILGLVCYVISFVPPLLDGQTVSELTPTVSPGLAFLSAIAALIGAILFWLIARPDRAAGGR